MISEWFDRDLGADGNSGSYNMSKMPNSVAEVHKDLVRVVITAHVRWTLALQLFGSMDRVKLLYDVADVLFDQIKQTMISDVVLKLSQLTDKARTGKNENLSPHRRREVVELNEPGLAAKLQLDLLLRSMERACKSIREMRNRTIAHRDWGRRAEATPVTNKSEIDHALDLAAQVMNAVHLHYEKTTIRYEPYPGSPDGDRLIYHLQRCAKLLDQTKGD
jgi:AbiU2